MQGMKGESGRDGLDGTDGVQGPPGNVLIIPTNTGSKGPDNRYGHYHIFLLAFYSIHFALIRSLEEKK